MLSFFPYRSVTLLVDGDIDREPRDRGKRLSLFLPKRSIEKEEKEKKRKRRGIKNRIVLNERDNVVRCERGTIKGEDLRVAACECPGPRSSGSSVER